MVQKTVSGGRTAEVVQREMAFMKQNLAFSDFVKALQSIIRTWHLLLFVTHSTQMTQSVNRVHRELYEIKNVMDDDDVVVDVVFEQLDLNKQIHEKLASEIFLDIWQPGFLASVMYRNPVQDPAIKLASRSTVKCNWRIACTWMAAQTRFLGFFVVR